MTKLLLSASAVLLLLASCATTGSAPASAPRDQPWIFTSNGLENDASTPYTIVSKDAPGPAPEFRPESGTFGKISWLFSMLDRMTLQTKLSIDAKEALYRALFTRLPAAPTPDFYRAVAVAGYFPGGKPLILYAQAFKPSSKGPATWSGVIQFSGNFIVTTEKATGVTSLSPIANMVMPNFNWYTNGLIFTDGRVVRGNDLYSKNAEADLRKEAGDDASLANVNVADLYTKDEVLDNDAGIEAMLASVQADPKADVVTKTLALLNLGQFRLYQGDADKAEAAFADAAAMGKSVTEPTVREVLDVQAPQMLELYRRVSKG